METLIFCFTVAAVYACNFLVGRGLGWLLTEFRGPLLRFKPFNCRGCMTFWLTFLPGLALARLFSNPIEAEGVRDVIAFLLSVVAFLSSFINYLYIKIKFKVYE